MGSHTCGNPKSTRVTIARDRCQINHSRYGAFISANKTSTRVPSRLFHTWEIFLINRSFWARIHTQVHDHFGPDIDFKRGSCCHYNSLAFMRLDPILHHPVSHSGASRISFLISSLFLRSDLIFQLQKSISCALDTCRKLIGPRVVSVL